MPVPLLGLDSDNGTEFINHGLYRYCEEHGITFTRSRPYRKNDSAHVEQKNGAVVRRLTGQRTVLVLGSLQAVEAGLFARQAPRELLSAGPTAHREKS